MEIKVEDKVTVIIVTYRSKMWIERCLKAVASQTLAPSDVILIENGSPSSEAVTADMVPQWVRFISNQENLGFAAANNQAARIAATRWLAFLNPDAFPEPDWLEKLLSASKQWPGYYIFGSTQLAYGLANRLDGVGDCYHAFGFAYRGGYGHSAAKIPPSGVVFAGCAAAMMFDRQLFLELGGFDENFFCYCEDFDLCFRARLRGFGVRQIREARVQHVGYGSTKRWSEFAVYHGMRNTTWVFIKCMPGYWFWIFLPFHITTHFLLFLLSVRRGVRKSHIRAWKDIFSGLPRVWKQRRRIQQARNVSSSEILRMMVWNPFQLVVRDPCIQDDSSLKPD